ncbi:uncharacterized protein DEA37_0013591 [Paragonimus westermani]|uniref:ACB domain-containing protein n=1 Tax=Paragonimus westermani TaxID=34504 RepID=A0A5J4NFT2_9TREM|nr:uncharacterized protein DEA37_0013591 [Paragonimus westermani]
MSLTYSNLYFQNFNTAADNVKHLKKRPSDNELLSLYGLFKQATQGDNTTGQPSVLSVKDRSKWNAWNSHKGLSKKEAQEKYVQIANDIIAKYGLS